MLPRTTPAPEGLEAWIRIINDVPDVDMERLQIEYLTAGGVRRSGGPRSELEAWGPAALDLLHPTVESVDLPTRMIQLEFAKYGSDLPTKMLSLQWARHAFHLIAGLNNKDTRVNLLAVPSASFVLLGVESGFIKVRPAPSLLSPLLEILDGLDVRRIRVCPNCEHFFWAGRLDKTGCSVPCSRVLRQQRLRDNRAYKKALGKRQERR